MNISLFWRMIGIGAVVGLFAIGYGLGKNGPIPSPSFSSAAYAVEDMPKTSPSGEEKKLPELNFELLNSTYHTILRAKVPGGWLLILQQDNSLGKSLTFYPDMNHEWNGGSLDEKTKSHGPREASEKKFQRISTPPYNPKKAAAKALELYDADKDGKISGDELDKAPGLKAALKVMNTNKEKGITADQISERVQKWINTKVGRTSMACQVLRDGQPLVGATVKFVPEKFLNDTLTETASGTTNNTGMAMISFPVKSGPDALPPGLALGIYRVEITKDGENIPAKYNRETVLGQEISLDNIEMQMGLKFNLKY